MTVKSVLQTAISLSLLPLSVTKRVLYEGPVGVKWCEELCFNTVGCEVYKYFPENLLCLQGNPRNTLERKMSQLAEGPYCNIGSRVTITRSNRRVCLQERTFALSGSDATRPQLYKLRMKGYHELIWENTTYLYKRYTDLKSWNASMKQCKEDGGLLAQMKEEFKWDMLQKILEIPSSYKFEDYMWIGLSDEQRNNKYVWTDGTAMKDKKRWVRSLISDEPTHTMLMTEENCAALRSLSNGLALSDFPCQFRLKFLCEVLTLHN